MRMTDTCAACLFDKQRNMTDDQRYLLKVKEIIENRKKEDTAPYLVYLFNREYEKIFWEKDSFVEIKKKYNDLVLSMENTLRDKIENAKNPLMEAMVYARVGNYIDFGAMNTVDEDTFLSLFEDTDVHQRDTDVFVSFIEQCINAKKFLLITDNCGEIVLDKLFLEQLRKKCPNLEVNVLVRGEEVLNDATIQDAKYIGMDKVANIVSSGNSVAGTVYEMLPSDVKIIFDESDVILAKGQGNYETLSNQGRHIFYSLLCKCELFTNRFKVSKLTGIFVEEN